MTPTALLTRVDAALAVAMRRETAAIEATLAYLACDGEPDERYLDELAAAHEKGSRRVRHLLCVRDRAVQDERGARPIPAEALIEAAKRARPESAA